MKAKSREIPKISVNDLANEVSKLLKEKELKIENNFYISLAAVLSKYQIPTKMYYYFASEIGKELSVRKRLKNSKGTP